MKMRKQRFLGVVLVIISGVLLAWAFAGQMPGESDAAAVLLMLPLGLYMLYSDNLIIYTGEQEDPGQESMQEDISLYTAQNRMKGAV